MALAGLLAGELAGAGGVEAGGRPLCADTKLGDIRISVPRNAAARRTLFIDIASGVPRIPENDAVPAQ